MTKLESKLNSIFLEAKDEPVTPELDGSKEKSEKGPHRPDEGTKFVQMKNDKIFKRCKINDFQD